MVPNCKKPLVKQQLSAAAALLLCAVGCGGAESVSGEDTEPAGASDEPSEASTAGVDLPSQVESGAATTAHSFEVSGTQYQMVDTGVELLLLAQGAPNAGKMPHFALLEEYGPLTMLELLLALAPEQEPGNRLVEQHPVEAAAWGRDDLSIRAVEFSNALIQKTLTRTQCENWAMSLLSPWESGRVVFANSEYYVPSDDYASGRLTYSPDALALCNTSGDVMNYNLLWYYSGGAWQSMYDDYVTGLVPNASVAIYGGPVSIQRRHRIKWQADPDADAILVANAGAY